MIYVRMIGPNQSEKTSLVIRVIVLNFWEKLAEGSAKEMKARPEVKEAYLGSEVEGC